MKNITCGQLGGTYDMEISANSQSEMANKAMNHMREKHADVLEGMTTEQKSSWSETLTKKWGEAPAM